MARRSQRRRRSEPPGPSGFIVVDKPSGRTSHDVVDEARRWFGTKRVGHLGTLDPQATGVLPLAIRAATKLVPFIEGGAKGYDGTIVLGVETDTLDHEGAVLRRFSGTLPERPAVEEALNAFRGDIQQIPPMYSAVKKDGVPLHRLARRGEEVERDPKWVTIDDLELTRFESPELDVRIRCSSGTYVRVIAADLGTALGCGAHLGGLRRTRSGPPFRGWEAADSAPERRGSARWRSSSRGAGDPDLDPRRGGRISGGCRTPGRSAALAAPCPAQGGWLSVGKHGLWRCQVPTPLSNSRDSKNG